MQETEDETFGLSASDLPHAVVRPQARRPRRRGMWVAAAATAAVAGMLAVLAPLLPELQPPAETAAPPDGAVAQTDLAPNDPAGSTAASIVAIGRIAPRGGLISVSTPRESREAIISRLEVEVGDILVAGDPVAVLETLPRAEAAAARAAAEVAMREAELQRARRELEASAAEASAAIAIAQARLAEAEAALARSERLAENANMVPAAQIEELRTDRAVRAAELARAEAQVLRLRGEVETHPDLLAARAALAAALADQQLAQADLGAATVRAPHDGRVVAIPAEVGEPAPPDGIARLAVAGPMAAILEVQQDRIHLVNLGDRVRLWAHAIDGEIHGRVVRIGLEVRRQAQFDSDPAANTDARVFEVEAELDEASSLVAQDLLNLQVLAAIEVGGGL